MRGSVALAAAVAGLLGASPAAAATYTQYVCSAPGGAAAPADRFAAAGPGAVDQCAQRGGLTLAVGGGAGAARATAWRYVPPPGTAIAGAVVRRSVRIPSGSGATYALAGSADACDARSACGDDVFDLPVPADGLSFGLTCPDDGCGGDGATVVLRALRIVLRDASAPAGALQAGPALRSTVEASDAGGGVRRITLLVDGRPRARRVFCRPPFVRAVPCPLRVRAELDPGRLGPGPHALAAAVQDATGVNTTTLGPVTAAAGGGPAPRPPAARLPDRPRLIAPASRLRNGEMLVLRARGLAGAGRIAFQVRVGSRWRTFAVRATGPGGSAVLRHRLRHTVRSVRYAFRVVTASGATSAPVRVAVVP